MPINIENGWIHQRKKGRRKTINVRRNTLNVKRKTINDGQHFFTSFDFHLTDRQLKFKLFLQYLLLFSSGYILSGCANQLPPGGGAIDTVPPKIVKVTPADGTTNFSGGHFELEFSKYVDKRTLKDALFISPAVEGDLEFDWTGTTVDVTFPGKLQKNKTYVVTVGTDLVDYNNHNRMAQSFTFRFSTGNKIDKGEINGKVYSDKPDGIMIFAYTKGDSAINPMKNKPDYISQTGKDGSYKLLGLAPAVYRVFAVRDQYGDLIYQPEQDEIGIPDGDIRITDTDTLYSGMDFFLTKMDTVKPRLTSAVMTDKYHLLVGFTKEVDSLTIRAGNFFLIDSTTKKSVKPVYAFKGNTKPTEIVLVTNGGFPLKDEVYLFADTIRDKLGNIFTNDYTSLTLSDKPDTTKPEIVKINPPNGSRDVDFVDTRISFYFNDAFDSSAAKNGIAFTDTSGNRILYSIYFIDDASFRILPAGNLEANKDYLIKINLSGFKDAAGNSYTDSVYTYKFRTINGLDFTGVSGSVIDADYKNNPYLVLQSLDQNKITYNKELSNSSKYSFERIQPGKYFLWGYYDTDSSKTYSYGKPFPYKPSEKFFYYPDTLNLRPRWTITNIDFSFGRK